MSVLEDKIVTLQADTESIDKNTIQVMNSLFKNDDGIRTKLFDEFKPSFLGAILFIVLSIRPTTNIIENVLKPNSELTLVLIKSIIFLIIFYIFSKY